MIAFWGELDNGPFRIYARDSDREYDDTLIVSKVSMMDRQDCPLRQSAINRDLPVVILSDCVTRR